MKDVMKFVVVVGLMAPVTFGLFLLVGALFLANAKVAALVTAAALVGATVAMTATLVAILDDEEV